MNYTPNLNLKKPAKTDPVLIDDLNDNMDILDTILGQLPDQRRIQAALGWYAGLDNRLRVYDTGISPVAVPLDGAKTDSGHFWEVHSGTWERGPQGLRSLSSGYNVATVDAETPDVTVSVDLVSSHTTVTRDIGLATRVVDADNYLYVTVGMRGGVIRGGAQYGVYVFKYESGVRTTLKQQFLPDTYERVSPVRLTLHIQNPFLSVWINHTPVTVYQLSEDEESKFSSATKHGLATHNMMGTGEWKNLVIWSKG